MCLAWWERAYARHLDEKRRARRVEDDSTAGMATNFEDLPDHDPEWLKTVSDVVFVMKKAQKCDIPTRGTSSSRRGAKRKSETEPASSRKKAKA